MGNQHVNLRSKRQDLNEFSETLTCSGWVSPTSQEVSMPYGILFIPMAFPALRLVWQLSASDPGRDDVQWDKTCVNDAGGH